MTTEITNPPELTVLAEWRVTYVMANAQQRRMFVHTLPATSYQAALIAAYELARVVCDATDGVWTPTDEFSAEVA